MAMQNTVKLILVMLLMVILIGIFTVRSRDTGNLFDWGKSLFEEKDDDFCGNAFCGGLECDSDSKVFNSETGEDELPYGCIRECDVDCRACPDLGSRSHICADACDGSDYIEYPGATWCDSEQLKCCTPAPYCGDDYCSYSENIWRREKPCPMSKKECKEFEALPHKKCEFEGYWFSDDVCVIQESDCDTCCPQDCNFDCGDGVCDFPRECPEPKGWQECRKDCWEILDVGGPTLVENWGWIDECE